MPPSLLSKTSHGVDGPGGMWRGGFWVVETMHGADPSLYNADSTLLEHPIDIDRAYKLGTGHELSPPWQHVPSEGWSEYEP
jgi:hypothetical protein